MTTIDHPLLEAVRILESGFLDPDVVARMRAEYHGRPGPHTTAQLRESVFEILGPGFKGCVPLAWMDVLDPDTIAPAFPELADVPNPVWMAIGIIDDVTMFELGDGKWFGDEVGVARPAADADRQMGGLFLGEDDARKLAAVLAEGREPVWAIPPTDLFPLGTEREFRAFMDEPA
jgi:hypothetical protein